MARSKEITIKDKKYTLQFPGARWCIRHNDACMNRNGVLIQEKYIDGLLEHVVVEPKVKFEDFDDDMESLTELVEVVEAFLRGN